MSVELREIDDAVLAELRQSVRLPPEQAHYVGGSVDDALREAASTPRRTLGPAASTSTVSPWGS